MSDTEMSVDGAADPASEISAVGAADPASEMSAVGATDPASEMSAVEPSSVPDVRTPKTPASESEGEELIAEGMERDYRAMPGLDVYDENELDEGDYEEIEIGQRFAAERIMRQRDLAEQQRRGVHVPRALREDDIEEPSLRRRQLARERAVTGEYGEVEGEEVIDLEKYDGPLKVWIIQDGQRREIQRRFKNFLVAWKDGKGESHYQKKIRRMCQDQLKSLHVSYMHLSQTVPVLAIWLADEPREMLKIFDETANDVARQLYPGFEDIHQEIHVRMTELPVRDEIRALRRMHLNGMIKVQGVVTRRTCVYPQLRSVKFNCVKCNTVMGPFLQNGDREVTPTGSCPACQSKGPFVVNMEQTIYRNYQRITLQESPGSVPAGRVPRRKDVILTDDLIDAARPGEEIEVTGIYTHNFDSSLNTRNGFPVFATIIEANYILKKLDTTDSLSMHDEDKKKIIEYSKKKNIYEILINSIAPSIHGRMNEKTAIAVAMFGGREKEPIRGRHRVRGDINVLILGDPGMGKSQFLKYVEKVAPRAVYATGKGASAVGLTASVQRDPLTQEWTLEGGALVLADRGVCLIDEFDKMNDQDRTSIHEAMEQQSISVSKAGIIATLQARCSVIAAANPVKGRYDSSLTFVENVDLTDPIISRFDILCVVRDVVDPIEDERLALFVLKSHMKNHPNEKKSPEGEEETAPAPTTDDSGKDLMPQPLLRKYIAYARTVKPLIDNIDRDKLKSVYIALRKHSAREDAIPIGVRHLESMVRISEARARMHLRSYVNQEDVNVAIGIMVNSFIDTQKFAVKRDMKKNFKDFLHQASDSNELLLHILQELVREQHTFLTTCGDTDIKEVSFEAEDFEAKAKQVNISNALQFCTTELFKANFSFGKNADGRDIIKKSFE